MGAVEHEHEAVLASLWPSALYNVFAEWFDVRTCADTDNAEVLAGFYAALDKIVRDDDFRPNEVGHALLRLAPGHEDDFWIDVASDYYQRARHVREFLEARGEAKPQPAAVC